MEARQRQGCTALERLTVKGRFRCLPCCQLGWSNGRIARVCLRLVGNDAIVFGGPPSTGHAGGARRRVGAGIVNCVVPAPFHGRDASAAKPATSSAVPRIPAARSDGSVRTASSALRVTPAMSAAYWLANCFASVSAMLRVKAAASSLQPLIDAMTAGTGVAGRILVRSQSCIPR